MSDVSNIPLSLSLLKDTFNHYDFKQDPYVNHLLERQRQGYDCSRQLQEFAEKHDTYCYDQLKSLYIKVNDMVAELGASLTDWYLCQCISRYNSMIQSTGQQLVKWTDDEKRHLAKLLRGLYTPQFPPTLKMSLEHLSPKVETLIDVLTSEAGPGFSGIVFVEQRVWVAALSEIISLHPRTKDLFNIGTFVGSSNTSKRKGKVADLAEPLNQQDTLEDFREGKLNLIMATSVLGMSHHVSTIIGSEDFPSLVRPLSKMLAYTNLLLYR